MLNTQTAANTFLLLGFRENIPISPMKLQKLVYFLYKQYLKDTDKELFSEDFLKWQYGPVLQSLYYEFNCFGASPINKFARDAQGHVEVIDLESNTPAAKAFEKVWSTYKRYSAIYLSDLTHKPDSAWCKATHGILDPEDIKNEPDFV